MFLYQDGKLYVDHLGEYVGVNITPSTVTLCSGETTKYNDGMILTLEEVMSKFGGEYKFPVSGDEHGRTKRTKKST